MVSVWYDGGVLATCAAVAALIGARRGRGRPHIDVAEALQQVASDEPEAQRDHASESGERRDVTGAKSVPSTHRALHAPIWPRSIGVIS